MAQFRKFAEEQIAKGESPMGLESAFAAKLQISASNWSLLKSSRPIGNKMARQIESNLGLEEGFLDVRRAVAADEITPGEQQFLAQALKAFRATNSVGRKNLKFVLREVAEGRIAPERIKL